MEIYPHLNKYVLVEIMNFTWEFWDVYVTLDYLLVRWNWKKWGITKTPKWEKQ